MTDQSQTEVDPSEEFDEEFFQSAGRMTVVFRVVLPIWSALILFSGIGYLYEIALALHFFRRWVFRGWRRATQWLLSVDPVHLVQNRPVGLPLKDEMNASNADQPWRTRLSRACYFVFMGPYDRFIYHLLHLVDPYPAKLGGKYRPFNTFPEFTLQGLITLSAAITLIIPMSDGLILNDAIIDAYLVLCLTFMFLFPIIHSRRLVENFPVSRLNLILAGTIAGAGYLLALILVTMRFNPGAGLAWQGAVTWDWIAALAQAVKPSPLSDWHAMIQAQQMPQSWADLDALKPFIPEVFAALASLGAIKVAGTAMFTHVTDTNHRMRGTFYLEAGRLRQARRAFAKIQDDKERTFQLLVPALIEGDEEAFNDRLREYGEEHYAPFWAAQPEHMRYLCLLFLDRLFQIDWARYKLVGKLTFHDVHPALAMLGVLPFGTFRDESIYEKLGFLADMAWNEAERPLNPMNPTRFPAGLFVPENDMPGNALEIGWLIDHMAEDTEHHFPELDRLGAIVVSHSLLASHNVDEQIVPEAQAEIRHHARACAERLSTAQLPLGRELEEWLIKDKLYSNQDRFGLGLDFPHAHDNIRKALDALLIRNMARARDALAASGEKPHEEGARQDPAQAKDEGETPGEAGLKPA